MNINNSHILTQAQAVHGKSADSPAFKARADIEGNAELGSQPFGEIVSKIARGLSLDTGSAPTQASTTDTSGTV